METKNMIGGIVSLAVVVICVAAIMMPVLNDATTTEKTFTNEGFYNLKEYAATDTYSAAWDSNDPYTLVVNGEEVALPTTAAAFAYTVIGNGDFVARFNAGTSAQSFQVYGGSNTASYQAATDSQSGLTSMSISVSEGAITFDNGSGTTKTITLTTSFYSIGDDGDYVMKSATSSAYITEDSEVIGIGTTSLNTTGSAVGEWFMVKGSVGDGFEITCGPYEATTSNVAAAYTEISGYVSLMQFTKVAFTATYDSTDTTVTYSQMLVPAEVTAELSQHLGSGEIAILNTIPAIVVVALIVAALGTFVIARRD